MKLARILGWVLTTALTITWPAAMAAQIPETPQSRIEALYASAEYDQALKLLEGSNDKAAELYRALCLLALGRQNEARAAVQSLVATSPDFIASAEEVPPRFVALLTETRQVMVPTILRKMFAEARGHYQTKAFDLAVPAFEKLLHVAEGPDVRNLDDVADLRVLAEGFIDLAKAPKAPVPQAAPSTPLPTPAPAPARPATTAPRALRQDAPPWPPQLGTFRMASAGSVRVQIDSTGRVTSAQMVKSIHPHYDARVLEAARSWQYTPATLNGAPAESELVVEVKIAR